MLKILLIGIIFNIHTGVTSDPTVLDHFETAQACSQALLHQGASKPDKDGNVLLFECLVPPDRPTAKLVYSL